MANLNRNSRVSDQIMEYYLQHGQNRDLEKFLRLRSSTTRSSSDGSLPALDELDRREQIAGKVGKSMENLSTLRNQCDRQKSQKLQNTENVEETEQTPVTQQRDLGDKNSLQKPQQQQSTAPVEMVVKETKSEKKSGRNFNFNLESVIEIKLPPATVVQNPLLVSPSRNVPASEIKQKIQEINSSGTQTVPEAKSVEQQTEEPIRPILKVTSAPATMAANPEETIDTTRDLSPVSSIASNKQKLEWDSLGDIGYDSNEKYYFCGASDLNETMKRCLQQYLVKRGLNFDEKVVVVQNVQKGSKNKEPSEEKQKHEARLKWQAVYQKYKDKYQHPSEISLDVMKPEAQSTPKIASLQSIPSKPGVSTQTSLTKALTKAIQVEQIVTEDKQIDTESLRSAKRGLSLSSATNVKPSIQEITSNDQQQGEIAESFEFYSSPPSQQVNQSSAGSTLKTSPEVTSISTSSSQSSSAVSTGTGGMNKQTDYNFEEELRLGMTLYNTICESRILPARVKQSLIDKIFRKMIKNDPKKRTKEELLKDCEKFKRPVREQGLSGVESMGSSGVSAKELQSKQDAVAEQHSVERMEQKIVLEKEPTNKEDVIVYNLDEPSAKSNETGNQTSRRTPQNYSLSSESTPQTSSSKQESNRTAKQKLSTKKPESTIKSSCSGMETDVDRRIRKAMTEYLKPMTHSEVDYENQRELKRSLEKAKKSKIAGRSTTSAPTTITSSGVQTNRIIELFRKEKQSQLLKIDKKIEHLKSIKMLLLEDQKHVNDIQDGTPVTYPVEKRFVKQNSFPSEEKENLYANTVQRSKSAASAPVYTSVHGDTPSDLSRSEIEYIPVSRSESGWNSHYQMQKMLQNRSKLETPTSDDSIATFIKNRKQKFIENYERHRKQMFEDQHHIYTKPYSGRESKQENYPGLDKKYSVRKIAKPPKPNFLSSDMFISSDSMSIPAANTLTNTTTHQYDIKSSRFSSDNLLGTILKPVATQTTGSILRTKPIFETKAEQRTTSASVQVPSTIFRGCQCISGCPCRHKTQETIPQTLKHTTIVDERRQKQDKQQQTKPSSIAYVITFQGDRQEKRKASNRKVSEKEQVYNGKSATDTDSSSHVTTENRTRSESRASVESDLLPLNEQLRRNRPGTLLRLKERQKCVNELNKLRAERNKQRRKLLLLTSDDSLKRTDQRQGLPPPPLAQRRIFSSKAIRENTRRQVKNLPEVLRKKEIEKINNLKRKNLILRDKFNRNLQRKVLHGQTDLSNSVRVIQD